MSFESMIDWRSPPITKRAKQSISYDDQSISYDDCFGFDLKEQPSTFADKVYLSDNNEGSDVSISDEIDVIDASVLDEDVLDKGEGSDASGSDSETVQDYADNNEGGYDQKPACLETEKSLKLAEFVKTMSCIESLAILVGAETVVFRT